MLRPLSPEEHLDLLESINHVPEKYQHLVHSFTTGTKEIGYKEFKEVNPGEWQVDDDAAPLLLDYWWCPSEEKAGNCPGPCDDGREHIYLGEY